MAVSGRSAESSRCEEDALTGTLAEMWRVSVSILGKAGDGQGQRNYDQAGKTKKIHGVLQTNSRATC